MSRNPIYIKLIHTKQWRALRKKKLDTDPVCEQCDMEGKSTPAGEVHHIVPVESVHAEWHMKQLMFTYSNLMSVCKDCHMDIHRQAFSHSKEVKRERTERATKKFIKDFL